jgi:hypothetical protein
MWENESVMSVSARIEYCRPRASTNEINVAKHNPERDDPALVLGDDLRGVRHLQTRVEARHLEEQGDGEAEREEVEGPPGEDLARVRLRGVGEESDEAPGEVPRRAAEEARENENEDHANAELDAPGLTPPPAEVEEQVVESAAEHDEGCDGGEDLRCGAGPELPDVVRGQEGVDFGALAPKDHRTNCSREEEGRHTSVDCAEGLAEQDRGEQDVPQHREGRHRGRYGLPEEGEDDEGEERGHDHGDEAADPQGLTPRPQALGRVGRALTREEGQLPFPGELRVDPPLHRETEGGEERRPEGHEDAGSVGRHGGEPQVTLPRGGRGEPQLTTTRRSHAREVFSGRGRCGRHRDHRWCEQNVGERGEGE